MSEIGLEIEYIAAVHGIICTFPDAARALIWAYGVREHFIDDIRAIRTICISEIVWCNNWDTEMTQGCDYSYPTTRLELAYNDLCSYPEFNVKSLAIYDTTRMPTYVQRILEFAQHDRVHALPRDIQMIIAEYIAADARETYRAIVKLHQFRRRYPECVNDTALLELLTNIYSAVCYSPLLRRVVTANYWPMLPK